MQNPIRHNRKNSQKYLVFVVISRIVKTLNDSVASRELLKSRTAFYILQTEYKSDTKAKWGGQKIHKRESCLVCLTDQVQLLTITDQIHIKNFTCIFG